MDPGFNRPIAWDVDLLAGYKSIFLGDRAKRRTPGGFWSLVCPQVWGEIRSGRYDAILLHGHSHAVNFLALLAAKTKGIPIFMRSDTRAGAKRKWLKNVVRKFILSNMFRFIDAFFTVGITNRQHYKSMNVPDQKLFDVPFSVDNDRFMRASRLTDVERDKIKSKYGLPFNMPIVLYASKLSKRKHPDDLVRAVAMLHNKGQIASLFLVGTGEMEQDLRDLVAGLEMGNVIFGGFVNQSELPKVFGASDVFVLPAENEPWGLIVNEAMCAGLPVVVSDEVGCVPDLVKDGVNGYQTKAGDVESLVKALEKLLADPVRRRGMGAASLDIIGSWSYEQCREGMLAALQQCVEPRCL